MEEKRVIIQDIEVNYNVAGSGQPILVLHGWGSSSDSWIKIMERLAVEGVQVIVPDLPGFGKTPAPKAVWGVEEYASLVNEFVKRIGLQEFILTGHSFGGQTAVQFAVAYPKELKKLVLIAPAAVRRTPGIFKKLVMFCAKAVALVLYLVPFEDLRHNIKNALYSVIRRRDYMKTQGVMREIFKKVITQDVTGKCPKVQVPTLIIWGDKDEMTPLQDAYLLQELIPHSTLKIIENGKHALNSQFPKTTVEFIAAFLK